MQHDLERLIKEHELLGMLAEAVIAALRTSPRDIPSIVAARNELAVTLNEHLAKEDGFLYQRSLSENEIDFAGALDKFERDFAALREDWNIYLEEWSADLIAHDFDQFAEATEALLNRLGARIAHENRLLYPLALQSGRIRLRVA